MPMFAHLNTPSPTNSVLRQIDLSGETYLDDHGRPGLLACVADVERQVLQTSTPKDYLPIDGMARLNEALRVLLLGPDHPVIRSRRMAVVQSLGGSGALTLGADLLRSINSGATVLVADPTRSMHHDVFSKAGFSVQSYPYLNRQTLEVRFEAMLDKLQSARPGSVVVLQACCHKPTGCGLSANQWDEVIATCQRLDLMPFLELAYLGLGDGLSEDAWPVRRFVDSGLDLLIATSFSHNFLLHGERIGALSVVCGTAENAERVLSQLKLAARANYSSPPTFGAAIVATILNEPVLKAQWAIELEAMRQRIVDIRHQIATRLQEAGVSDDRIPFRRHRGLYSHTGIAPAEAQRLRAEFGILAPDSGCVCMAAVNPRNVDAVAGAFARVLMR